MTENQDRAIEPDDTEGHRIRSYPDAERSERDDTEGHLTKGPAGADAEKDEADDTEGHRIRSW